MFLFVPMAIQWPAHRTVTPLAEQSRQMAAHVKRRQWRDAISHFACNIIVGWKFYSWHLFVWCLLVGSLGYPNIPHVNPEDSESGTLHSWKTPENPIYPANPLNPYENNIRAGSYLEPVRHFQGHWVDSMPAWYDFVHRCIDTLPAIEWRSCLHAGIIMVGWICVDHLRGM